MATEISSQVILWVIKIPLILRSKFESLANFSQLKISPCVSPRLVTSTSTLNWLCNTFNRLLLYKKRLTARSATRSPVVPGPRENTTCCNSTTTPQVLLTLCHDFHTLLLLFRSFRRRGSLLHPSDQRMPFHFEHLGITGRQRLVRPMV